MPSSQSLEQPSQQDYDSYLGNGAALMHLIRSNLGLAVLSIPWAMSHAGVILGPILLLILMSLALNTMIDLTKCARWHSQKVGVPSMDYGEVAYYSIHFGPVEGLRNYANAGRLIVNISIVVLQFGIGCIYYVFIAQNMRQVVASYWPGIPEDRVLIAVLWIPLTWSTFSRNLAGFAWISALGNLLYFTAAAMVLAYVWARVHFTASTSVNKSVEEVFIFLTTAVTSVEGASTVLPLENAVKSKESFTYILITAFAVLCVIETAIGITGYLAFGSSVCASLTLNLPLSDAYSNAVRIIFVLVTVCSFPIQMYVPVGIVWRRVQGKFQLQSRWWEIGVKIAISTLLCVLAVSSPFIGSIISLAGSIVSAPLQFVYPPLIMLSTLAQQHSDDATWHGKQTEEETALLQSNFSKNCSSRQISYLRYFIFAGKSVMIVIFGTVVVVVGLVSAISNLIQQYEETSASSTCRGGTGATMANTDMNHSSMDINITKFHNESLETALA